MNPDTIRAQMESAVVFGLTAALYGEITFEKGRVEQRNFHDYPMLRIHEMPEVDVHIVESTEPMGGVGEPGVPPIAPGGVQRDLRPHGQAHPAAAHPRGGPAMSLRPPDPPHFLLLGALLLAVAACKETAPAEPAASKDEAASRAAFLAAYPVFMHPRCMNCHPAGDAPLQGDDSRPHGQNVKRGPDGMGLYALKCADCHQRGTCRARTCRRAIPTGICRRRRRRWSSRAGRPASSRGS